MEDAATASRPRFSPENCATCNGQAIGPNQKTCTCCQGKGRILVAQPSKKCPRCGGSGKPERGNFWSVEYCVICRGTGWMWTEYHFDESTIRGAASALLNTGCVARSTSNGEGEK